MELTASQIVIVGLIASALGVVIRLLATKFGVYISKAWMTVIVAVISFITSLIFKLPIPPEYTDPLQYLDAWITILSGYIGMATAIYNIILDKVLDKLELNAKALLERFQKG